MIIREEYPTYYKKIANSPKIFNEKYSSEKGSCKEEEEIKRFLRIAQTSLGEVEIPTLNKILTKKENKMRCYYDCQKLFKINISMLYGYDFTLPIFTAKHKGFA